MTTPEEVSSDQHAAYHPSQSGLKRRRVAQACKSCRRRKSKCDGRQPVCGRCEGYGHVCEWADVAQSCISTPPSIEPGGQLMSNVSTANGEAAAAPTSRLGVALEDPATSIDLVHAVRSYDELVINVLDSVHDSSYRGTIDSQLLRIRSSLPGGVIDMPTRPDTVLSSPRSVPVPTTTREGDEDTPVMATGNSRRYLGEISDVSFYHAVKQVFNGGTASSTSAAAAIPSYDQGENYGQESNIYFSSVHIAYPFICKPLFMARYDEFWTQDTDAANDTSLITLLYVIFAIGAYYNSFPSLDNVKFQKHQQYFEHASRLSTSTLLDCSLNNIQVLLAQCVFLLATSQIDKCWNILGLTVRIAQAIGLHVEDGATSSSSNPNPMEGETKRRAWYTMYNLDRLLALQLGRPVIIHEGDFNVQLPSKTEDNYSGPSPVRIAPDLANGSSSIDFFTHVIKFSEVVSQVISDLYKPCQMRMDPQEMLANTMVLNEKILEWRLGLPRHLRFDKAHTFERSVVFRRQRNMLAIKFHHIRALIHRPYLRLSWLQQISSPQSMLLQSTLDQVIEMERICISEAQHTAYLLHDVTDERSLVQDFPWWQMISCLLCASSILFVASACIDPTQVDAELQSQTLSEDAETCLQVFDALSINSSAARLARDMLRSLKLSCSSRRDPETSPDHFEAMPSTANELNAAYALISARDGGAMSSIPTNPSAESAYTLQDQNQQSWNWSNSNNKDVASAVPGWPSWPMELSDSMTWSSQFLDTGSLAMSYNNLDNVTGAGFLAEEEVLERRNNGG